MVFRYVSFQHKQTNVMLIPLFFQRLEENIVTFVKNELEVFKKVLGPKYPECLEKLREEDEVLDDQEEEQRRSSRDAFLKITLTFLRKIKQDQLADSLQSSKMLLRVAYAMLVLSFHILTSTSID